VRQINVILLVLFLIALAVLVSRPNAVQAQSPGYAMLRHVKSDDGGNMVDADNGKAVYGAVRGLSCVAPNDCWVALQ